MRSEASTHPSARFASRIYYEVVSHCNLRCSHCSDLYHAPVRELPAADVLSFHEQLAQIGVRDSVITGGEPTLHTEFEELVDGLCAFGGVTVTTNGLGVTGDRAARLLRRNPRLLIQVSLDGATQATFEAIRGRNAFGLVTGFIDELSAQGLGLQLGVSMTIFAHNLHEVDALIEYAEERDIGVVHFPQLVPVGFARENWTRLAPPLPEQLELERQLVERAGRLKGRVPRLSINRLDRLAGWFLFDEKADCLQTLTLKVAPDGEILPCPTTSNRDWTLGSFRDRPQPDHLLERLRSSIVAIRAFSTTGVATTAGAPSVRGPRSAECMRSCESCWLLAPPRVDIAEYGRWIREGHIADAYAADPTLSSSSEVSDGDSSRDR